MNALSLFDGISCGRVALERGGHSVDNYFASELDRYAIKIAQKNYPTTRQVGDVRGVRMTGKYWIDLILGGSPCQGFSFMGKQLAFDDPRSRLFFEYVRIVKEARKFNPDLLFLLENVRMKEEYLRIISDMLEVEPIFIDSALMSAQTRKRYYWTNIKGVTTPADKGIVLRDILETDGFGAIKDHGEFKAREIKAMCIDANYHKGVDNHGQRTVIIDGGGRLYGYTETPGGTLRGFRNDKNKSTLSEHLYYKADTDKVNAVTTGHPPKIYTVVPTDSPILVGRDESLGGFDRNTRVYSPDGKSPAILAASSSGGHHPTRVAVDRYFYRKLTPLECERLQTLPDNYTAGVSDTQRYKGIGNGWTVDVITHILSFIK